MQGGLMFMSSEIMYALITKMHIKLNKLIEKCNYDLLNNDVQRYSKRLDKVIVLYNKATLNDVNQAFYHTHVKGNATAYLT